MIPQSALLSTGGRRARRRGRLLLGLWPAARPRVGGRSDVRRARRPDSGGLQGAAGRGSSDRVPSRDRPPADPPLPARGGRGAAGRARLHGARPGEGRRREGPPAPVAGAGSDAHRPRRARRAARGAPRRRGPVRPARRLRPRRTAGIGEDDVCGQARVEPEVARALSAARRGRPRAAGGGLPAADARPADRNPRLRSGRAHGSGRGRPGWGRRGAADGTRHGHHRHGGPSAPGRRPDARSAIGHRRRRALGDSLRGGRDDRAGRRAVGRGVLRGASADRNHSDEDRRRRARRRRADRRLDARQADQVRRRGGEARGLRAVPPGPDGVADPGTRGRADADRKGRSPGRRGRRRVAWPSGPAPGSSRSTTCATSWLP